MEYAMVSTVSPKASDTPRRPMPTSGNAAAMTALPQPAKVSQKVPMGLRRAFAQFHVNVRYVSQLLRSCQGWLGTHQGV